MKKRDGRLVSRVALEEMRLMALQRMGEGESPAEVASSLQLDQNWCARSSGIQVSPIFLTYE
ncbi:transposase [Xanthomonas oryzae pv. oryzicola]|nr:transposase [Xanthomonas oryzae pv. oryzicola]